jgi:hypothetical protein
MSGTVHYDTDLRIDSLAGRYDGRIEAHLHLDQPGTRIMMRVPRGSVGRAQAKFAGKNWAAAHYWTEETDEGNVVLYEFSEALPAGDVRLVVPFFGALAPDIAAVAQGKRETARLQSVLPHMPGGAGEWTVRLGREGNA